ncbi:MULTISPECIES: hypothetical protein [Fusobacterium]|jgi:hypothetical protein|uniref:Uncharacterized protein n=1 Tax=Fusobacterium hominis TaxID=2764326 RepID=A0A7G9GXA4_9FUSO|nr:MULTISPECIES: hypothetical protein [Fusobacterium]QNM15436.1 hypothetical protein H9Q81_00930 [Fusobacterium hominis]
MIRTVVYFIISSFLLFFSTNVNTRGQFKVFQDKTQAIYSIHSYDEIESYDAITLDKIEILPKTIIKTGTPNTFIKAINVKTKYKNYTEKSIDYSLFCIASILERYKSRILLI